MRRMWRVFYLICFICIIGSFGAFWCLEKLGAPLPEQFGVEKNRSYLEGKIYASFPDLTVESFVAGEFQEGVEGYVADRFPARDDVLLFNAAWQRSLISGGARLFGYDVYPTFYGSDYAYDEPRDEVVQLLDEATPAQEERYETAAAAYRDFASRHPELCCYFYEVDRMSSSTRNPTHDLVGPSVDTEFLDEHFFDLLGESVVRIDGAFADADALSSAFFRTDHHWGAPAAYGEYQRMLSVMLPDATPAEVTDRVTWSEVPFYGSTVRSGLCLTNKPDYIDDLLVDMSGYAVTVDGKDRGPGALDHAAAYAEGEVGEDLFTNRYAEYFHGDFGLLEIRNDSSETDRALLIVGDSFDNCVDRYFAANYRCVYVLDPRHSDISVEELLSSHEVDDVLFLMGSTVFPLEENYALLAE